MELLQFIRRHAARMVRTVHLLIEREVLFDDARTPRHCCHCGNDSDGVIAEAGVPREVDLAELQI